MKKNSKYRTIPNKIHLLYSAYTYHKSGRSHCNLIVSMFTVLSASINCSCTKTVCNVAWYCKLLFLLFYLLSRSQTHCHGWLYTSCAQRRRNQETVFNVKLTQQPTGKWGHTHTHTSTFMWTGQITEQNTGLIYTETNELINWTTGDPNDNQTSRETV